MGFDGSATGGTVSDYDTAPRCLGDERDGS